ncbi:hypothetical protein C8Q79DRAFT_937859 [Trametes meyenii]|nr:hypothetical protein C8Q79DRAFT_937859 [Trametes meyenii]
MAVAFVAFPSCSNTRLAPSTPSAGTVPRRPGASPCSGHVGSGAASTAVSVRQGMQTDGGGASGGATCKTAISRRP